MNLLFIKWNVSPEIFSIKAIPFYWYFLLIFAALIFIGWIIFKPKNDKKTAEKDKKIKTNEKQIPKKSDNSLFYIIGILIVGAFFLKFAFPNLSHIGPLTVRWYGLLWACAIFVAYLIVKKIFKHEGHPDIWMDKIFMYITIGLIVGARLGHCFFYEWQDGTNYYLTHPWALLYIWHGGLSSHGGAIGMLIAAFLYDKKVSKKGFIWLMDRLVIGIALGATCIRLGNLMNSEIYGEVTNLPWGFIFVRNEETLPKHPTQIYEMLYCLVTFAVIWWMYWKKQAGNRNGLILGVAFIGIFVTRFLLEFIKNDQEMFEKNMLLNMGQLLSLPFIIWGIWLIFRALNKKRKLCTKT